MTSQLQAIAEVGRATGGETRVDDLATPASEEAVRLALQLREIRSSRGGRTVLFVPASITVDAAMVTGDAAHGLLGLHEGPVLVMDLRANGEARGGEEWLAEQSDHNPELGSVWGSVASSGAVVSRPFAGRRDSVPYAASDEFAGRLDDARARYPYVLCIGGPVAGSVETLITASLFDGVVLSVAPGRTTRSDMQRVTTQLRRTHANLIGFVVDARLPGKGV